MVLRFNWSGRTGSVALVLVSESAGCAVMCGSVQVSAGIGWFVRCHIGVCAGQRVVPGERLHVSGVVRLQVAAVSHEWLALLPRAAPRAMLQVRQTTVSRPFLKSSRVSRLPDSTLAQASGVWSTVRFSVDPQSVQKGCFVRACLLSRSHHDG